MQAYRCKHAKIVTRYFVIPFPGSTSKSAESDEIKKDEHSMTLKKLEKQYESSRYLTHVARGVGLGFASTQEDSDPDH